MDGAGLGGDGDQAPLDGWMAVHHTTHPGDGPQWCMANLVKHEGECRIPMVRFALHPCCTMRCRLAQASAPGE